jgi:hypothetical protein
MRKVTPRIEKVKDCKSMIGKILVSNLFSTFRGRLLYIKDGKCYFETVENPEFTKYNKSAGQIDYIPESMVITMDFEEDE